VVVLVVVVVVELAVVVGVVVKLEVLGVGLSVVWLSMPIEPGIRQLVRPMTARKRTATPTARRKNFLGNMVGLGWRSREGMAA
jgi:hypothetical protein